MKLRNKESGEIGYFCFANWNNPVLIIMDKNGVQLAKYNSLVDLNEEWKDYEEPKGKWFISNNGQIHNDEGHERFREERKLIGNYFETREEAERVVEKLKAWKRLKDKGFRFDCWDNADRVTIHDFVIYCNIEDLDNINKDLDLLFGGEE